MAVAEASTRPAARVQGIRLPLNIVIPAALLIFLVLLCFAWPEVYHLPPPTGGSVLNANLPMFSPGHIFGTDELGNDMFSRIVYGGRVSLEVGVSTQVIGIVIGGGLGVTAGLARGVTDTVIMRIMDVFIAVPSVVLALAITDGLGASELHVIWAISVFTIPGFARLTRSAALRLREEPFVVAAMIMCTPRWRTVLRHLFPNMAGQVATYALLGAGVAIIVEGALSYLGLGIPPPGASWGNMIAEGETMLSVRPSLVIVPSLFLLGTVASLNILGDGLRRRRGRV